MSILPLTVELHSMKVVVVTTTVRGKIDILPTEECQHEIWILFSPNVTFEMRVKRAIKADPENIQKERGSSSLHTYKVYL